MYWSTRSVLARKLRAASVVVLNSLLILSWLNVAKADNVLFIIADDLGADSFGLFSTASSTAPTPTLDGLAANGVRFTRCWSNPTCSPSRASLLTGRHGFRTGVGSPGHVINQSEGTIADAFNSAGYQTACVGKWHLSNDTNGGADNPNLMGFGHYCGATGGGLPNFYLWSKVINGQTQRPRISTYATTENVNDAIDWIEDQNSDWFLWLAFNAPHTPFHLPPNTLHSYNLSGTEADIDANPTPYYQAAIEAMDTEIGRLLSSIDPAVLADTTIIFVGDNGTPGGVSPGVVEGSKDSLYEGGVHVPCIVSGSAVLGPLNRTNDSTIHFVDIFDTLLELAGLDPELNTPVGAATDSKSFAGHLFDPNLESTHVCQFSTKFNTPAVPNRDGDTIANDQFKLIRFASGQEEFLDRVNESTNLLDSGLTATQNDNYVNLIEKFAALLEPPKVVVVVRDIDSEVRPDLINQLEVVFNQNVNVAATDLVMQNDSTSQSVDLQAAGFSYNPVTFTATWDLSPLSSPLDAAFYSFDLAFNNIVAADDGEPLDGDGNGSTGPDYMHPFYVAIPGDADLDGDVDVLGDGFTLVGSLGSPDPTWATADFNEDDEVDVLGDAFILIGNLEQNVQP